MKTLVSILLAVGALMTTAFAVATSASAAPYGYYDDDMDAYREYCRDPWYRERYAYYCNRFYDEDYDDNDYDDSYSYSAYPYYRSYYPYSSYDYPYSDYRYSTYPYSYGYGPSIGFSFGFNNYDRRNRYYRRHWRH